MAVEQQHRYLNESERANIYDYLKLKKTLWSPWFMQQYFSYICSGSHLAHSGPKTRLISIHLEGWIVADIFRIIFFFSGNC